MVRIDLGCGRYKKEGALGIDQSLDVGPDIVADFSKGDIPLKSDSVDEVYCIQVMEHVSDIFSLMNRIHRILKPGGRLIVEVPYWSSEGAFRDPTHVRFFSEKSFDYWDPSCECAYYLDSSPFRVHGFEYIINPRRSVQWIRRILGIQFLKAFNNMIVGLRFDLRPVKGDVRG